VEPFLEQSATRLARMIRTGEVTSQEVVEAHIRRIESVNPCLNAVVAERFEAAREEARAADDRLVRQPAEMLPPLLGVPCTVKESIAVAGMPNSSGLVSRAQIRAQRDATVVARLRAAGAIVMGVTNTSEVTAFPGTSNRVYGHTRNAYDPGRSPGGSSGGEGAIVGAGGSPFGLGTDVGGSIRIPAFCNGVFGHKPSGGLVPGTGQYPAYQGRMQRINATGPLARRAEDLMPLLRILAGPDGLDDQCNASLLDERTEFALDGLRVIVVDMEPLRGRIDEALRNAQQGAAYALAGRGARVEMRTPRHLASSLQIFLGLIAEAGGLRVDALLGEGRPIPLLRELARCLAGRSPHTMPVLLSALFERLGSLSTRRLARYAALGHELRSELETLLGDDGVLLAPPARDFPPRLERELSAGLTFLCTPLFNALELPATQVPLGLGEQGLPLGVQVVGAHGQDPLTIAVARALEQSFGGWVPPARWSG